LVEGEGVAGEGDGGEALGETEQERARGVEENRIQRVVKGAPGECGDVWRKYGGKEEKEGRDGQKKRRME
jgi:hypothetical protein